MKITNIETYPVRVPIDPSRAIKGGRGAHTESPFLILRVQTDEGIYGVGEVSCTPGWSGEDQVTANRVIKAYLEPVLIGEDPTQIERLTTKMRVTVANNLFTKSGIEMALWDILGKVAGLPVYRLLGGAVREVVPTKFSISGQSPDIAAGIASWAANLGFMTMKVKVGIQPDGDVARVRAVRAAIGQDIRLGADANGGWSVSQAIQTIPRLREFAIYFAEQPVPALDVNWLADVRTAVDIPVMADESVNIVQDAMAVARARAADVLSIYVGKGGGIGPARKIAAIAEGAGLVCTVGSNLELGIASAAMIHLAMSTTAIDAEQYPCDILGPFFYEGDVIAEALPIKAGRARPFERPGLGVELDMTHIERYRVH